MIPHPLTGHSWARRAAWRILLASACAASVMPLAGQASILDPFASAGDRPSGLEINRFSLYGELLDLPWGALVSGVPAMTYTPGAEMDVGLYATRPRVRFALTYDVDYDRSVKGLSLKGFDNVVAFSLTSNVTPRLALSLSGSADDALYTDLLFAPFASLSLANNPTTPLTPGTGLVGQGNTPLSLALYGVRRRDATGVASLTFHQSSRLTWSASGEVTRELPSPVGDESLATSEPFPGVTFAQGQGGVSFAYTPRTTLSAGGYYAHYSMLTGPFDLELGTLGVYQLVGSVGFVSLSGGGGASNYQPRGASSTQTGAYRGEFSTGARGLNQSLVLSVSREAGNTYGLAIANTFSAGVAWSWYSKGSRWTSSAGFNYERLLGGGYANTGGYGGVLNVSRRLSRRNSIVLTATWLTTTTPTILAGNLQQRAVRLAWVWVPGRLQ